MWPICIGIWRSSAIEAVSTTSSCGLGAAGQFTDSTPAGRRPLFTGTPAQILQRMQRYQEVGGQDFRVDFPSPSFDGVLQAMERVATEVRPPVQA